MVPGKCRKHNKTLTITGDEYSDWLECAIEKRHEFWDHIDKLCKIQVKRNKLCQVKINEISR